MVAAVVPSLLDLIANHDGHIVGASQTGSGKTAVMLAAIMHKNQLTDSEVRWFCASGKMSLWMGLEQQIAEDNLPRVINVSLSNPSSIEYLLQRLQWAIFIQESREKTRIQKQLQGVKVNPRPFYFIIDEWLIVLQVALRHSSYAYKELISLVEALIFKGRQDKCFLWLWAQGHQVQTLHLSTDVRRNLGVLALGGSGNNESVAAAITDSDLISDGGDRQRLKLQYQQLLLEDPTGRIFYTSLGGHKVERMMQLPDMEAQRLFASTQQERKVLEQIYAKGATPNPQVQQPKQEEDCIKEPTVQERELKVKEQELWLKFKQYQDGVHNAESRWNLITLGFGTAVFVIYAFPPFSGALQTMWQGAVKVGQAVNTIVTNTDKAVNYWAPNLQKTPAKGEKINGYRVSSPYGQRIAPVAGASTNHKGVDIAAPSGTPIYAIGKSNETVDIKCWWDNGGGGNVATYYSQGWKFQYLHLSKCKPGKAKGGTIIAAVGNTGLKSGDHLHFEQIKLTGGKIPPYTGYIFWALTGNPPQPLLVQKNDSNQN